MRGLDDNWPDTRLLLAAIAAPLIGVTTGAVLFTAMTPSLIAYAVFWGFVFALLFGVPTMLLIGLPAHALLMRSKARGLLAYLAAGAAAGIAAGVAAFVRPSPSQTLVEVAVPFAVLGSGTGALCAAIFWLIRRPDRVESR